MPEVLEAQESEQQQQQQQQARLTPMPWPPKGYEPGKHAPWFCNAQENGQEEIYGPDELGEYVNAIDEMTQGVNRTDSAARMWEVLQAWEQRLFRRGYHFLSAGQKGWGMFGGSVSGVSTGAQIMATGNAMKLFSCNIFGQRHKKIVSLLSREVPGTAVVANDENDPVDQAAADEAEKYLKVYAHDANLKKIVTQTASYFYTDDRVTLLTYTVADQTRWGTEMPEAEQPAYGAPTQEGVSPETEQMPSMEYDEKPARRETTMAFGKLESKVPIMADEEHEMGWVRCQHEVPSNMLKSKYPWIRNKIATQGNVGGMDQIDRLARINVRLAVQASSSSGEAYKSDSTETVTFYRPSEYGAIKDDSVREVFEETFPDGMEVWHAGGQLAFVRNARMSKHVKIVHPTPGDGQNRESIGTNLLPLQKILNANISLLDRYFRSAIPRRFALEPYIDTQAINSQSNDPAKVTPVTGLDGQGLRIADITGVEQVPTPNMSMVEFIQWLINGAPEAMDGGAPEAFGLTSGEADQGVFRTAVLKRDQALQVFSMPWAALCDAVACISLQAIESAGRNRKANIAASLPGQQKLEIEISKLQGSVLVHPESLEIPRTLAEQEEQMIALLENSNGVELYKQIVTDPRNLAVFAQMPSLSGLEVAGADAVEQQQGEFEILMRSGPEPNPAYVAIEEQIAMAEGSEEAQTPDGQQMLVQLQQALSQTPPEISTVPVAQDNSENHTVHAAIVLGMMTSPTGRKLKYGNDEQKAIYRNLHLHWQEHVKVLQQLTPPPQVEMKASVSIDPTKLPPDAQAKALQALGLQVSPQELQPVEQTHEITEETEGLNPETGVPTKRKVSVVGKPLN